MNRYSRNNSNNNSTHSNDKQIVITVNRLTKKFILKAIGVIAVIFLSIKFLPFLSALAAPLGISFIASFLLSPLVDKMENHGLNRASGIAIIYLIFGIILFLFCKYMIPGLGDELKSITATLQNENSESIINKLQSTFSEKIPILENPEVAALVSTKLHDLFQSLMQKSLAMLVTLLSSFTMFVIVPFMTFFLLKDGRRIKKFVIQCVPNRYFEMSLNLLYKTNIQLGNYIRGQLLVSSIIAALSIIALYSLDVPYFFIIGIIAGLANMIPYFGPVVGALPAILVAIIEKGSLGPVLGIVIAFAVIQLLDNVFVSPLIVSKSIQIHPLLVIIVILVGSNFGGMLGMLVAVPAFAVAQVLIKEIIWSFKHYRLTG